MSRRGDYERDQWLRSFGAAVRETRDHLGISQEKLSFRTGLDRTYISGVERGTRNPTFDVIWRMASGLQTTADDLLRLAERIRSEEGT